MGLSDETARDLNSYRIKERLYRYDPTGYCGVYLTEDVMKKLVKITYEFENEVRRILTDNIDKLYATHWSLAYPNGKQTPVRFANKEDLERRVELFKARQPLYDKDVYIGTGFCEQSKKVISLIENETKVELEQSDDN